MQWLHVEYSNDNVYSFNDSSNNIAVQLLNLPLGYHYLILYPNNETIRNIYAEYIGIQIIEYNAEILFLPYYDTTDKVRQVLKTNGLDVSNYEKNNSLTLIDFGVVVDNPYLGIPAAFGLKEFINKIQTYRKNKKKNLVIIADMSLYSHFDNNVNELLKYEKLLHGGYGILNWKQLCLYHKLDFNRMFIDEQKQQILDYHKDKVIII
jgi:hypothetical protein